MSDEVIAINASLLAVYDHTQRKKVAFVTSNRVMRSADGTPVQTSNSWGASPLIPIVRSGI